MLVFHGGAGGVGKSRGFGVKKQRLSHFPIWHRSRISENSRHSFALYSQFMQSALDLWKNSRHTEIIWPIFIIFIITLAEIVGDFRKFQFRKMHRNSSLKLKLILLAGQGNSFKFLQNTQISEKLLKTSIKITEKLFSKLPQNLCRISEIQIIKNYENYSNAKIEKLPNFVKVSAKCSSKLLKYLRKIIKFIEANIFLK